MALIGGRVPSSTDSRCITPQQTKLTWVPFVDTTNKSVIELDSWLESLPEAVREAREGALEALEEMAAEGQIDATETWTLEPVQRHPDLFELKWRFGKKSKKVLIRQYHSEPSELPLGLVRLHRHIKSTAGTAADIENAQNAEMAFARLRHVGGETRLWGTR